MKNKFALALGCILCLTIGNLLVEYITTYNYGEAFKLSYYQSLGILIYVIIWQK